MAADEGMSRADTERVLSEIHAASFGWALSCCRFDREEAGEVLQTSYLKILEGRARFNGHSSMRTWVFGVVRRAAAERRRRRVIRSLSLARWAQLLPASDPYLPPELAPEQVRQARRLREMLSRLSPRQRELLHLVFYQELTIEEGAGVLGISVGTARVHYERGKAALRGMLSAPAGAVLETDHGR